ncbi:unnamed protein product [Oikopleura dioica]|uniref:Pannexin n=1 Tax=Oikopleura dioica TaxID=34765 RepID=E4WUW1_OIKDI|nr:unnamed protein product [Oikopleura dioica]
MLTAKKHQYQFRGDRVVSWITVLSPITILLFIVLFLPETFSIDGLQIKGIPDLPSNSSWDTGKDLPYIRSFCWAHMSHFDIDQNGKIIATSKISLDHYQFLPAFMLMVCSVFIGVEIFWWVGEIERVPFHVDYFINCLEDAFEEFGRTLLLEKNSDMSKAKTVVNSACEESDGINDETAPILSYRISTGSLTNSELLEIYHEQKTDRNFSNFELFVQRMARSQDLVKTIFARRILRFFALFIINVTIYLIYLTPTRQLHEFRCPLPEAYRIDGAEGAVQETVQALFSGVSQRTLLLSAYFCINLLTLITLPFCWTVSCAAWRRGYNLLFCLPFVETVLTLLTGLPTAQLIALPLTPPAAPLEPRRNRLMWSPRKFDKFKIFWHPCGLLERNLTYFFGWINL